MTHSPTPWHVVIVSGSYKRPAYVKSGDKLVASCMGDQLDPDATSIGEATANAAFITRAVNSHAALLAALEQIADDYKTYRGHEDYDEGPMSGEEAQRIARSTLAAVAAIEAERKI
jgi:hypothetical protein